MHQYAHALPIGRWKICGFTCDIQVIGIMWINSDVAENNKVQLLADILPVRAEIVTTEHSVDGYGNSGRGGCTQGSVRGARIENCPITGCGYWRVNAEAIEHLYPASRRWCRLATVMVSRQCGCCYTDANQQGCYADDGDSK